MQRKSSVTLRIEEKVLGDLVIIPSLVLAEDFVILIVLESNLRAFQSLYKLKKTEVR